MSLFDTWKAAVKEADEAGSLPWRKHDQEDHESEDAEERSGFSKPSAARAKPAREIASGVRIVDSKGASLSQSQTPLTKEQKREQKQARRDEQDRRSSAVRVLLGRDPKYRKGQRVWWILLGIGMVATLASWILSSMFPEAGVNPLSPLGLVTMALIVSAYACIIIAFVYDWRFVRPMRNKADQFVASLSTKKVEQILDDDARDFAKAQIERAEAKAKRRSKRKERHEQHK